MTCQKSSVLRFLPMGISGVFLFVCLFFLETEIELSGLSLQRGLAKPEAGPVLFMVCESWPVAAE